MPTQQEKDSLYMGTALLHARLSKAKRKQVGAVIVTSTGVIIPGYNGSVAGTDNQCEDHKGKTKPSVLHGELNCILKAAKDGISVLDSVLYTSLSPCLQCSAMLAQAGIKEVVYNEVYRDTEGLDLLESCGVVVRNFV